MRGMWQQRLGAYVALLGLGAVLFLVNLGGPSLWDVDEGRNAACALEMLESGNWVVPTFNGDFRCHKPALIYWLQMAAYSACGVNEFAARLPSAIAALLTLLLVYELGRRLFDHATGLLGGLVLASCPQFLVAGHFANPDALLTCFVVLTLLLAWHCLDARRWAFLLLGASAGLAVLAKGPVGVVVPALAFGLFLAWSGRLRWLLQRRLGWAALAFVLVALPWYVWVGVDTRFQFLSEFLGRHNLDRVLEPMENHSGSPLYYPLVLLAGLAPWSIFLGLTLWYGGFSALTRPWQRWRATWETAHDADRSADVYRFLICWVVAFLLVFTVAATKLPNYVLPTAPPLALLTARFLMRWWRGTVAPPAWLLRVSLVMLLLIGVAVSSGVMAAAGALPFPLVRSHRTLPGLELWAFLGLVPVLAALALWGCVRQRRAGLVVGVTAAALLLTGPFVVLGGGAMNAHKAPQPLVEAAGALNRSEELRIGGYQVDHLPSLNFYVQRQVKHCFNDQDALNLLATRVRVILFVSADAWRGLEPKAPVTVRVLGRHRDFYRGGDVVVVSNR